MSEKIINCAIYTRKSTEEGLEQDFNSLDNQYEFCTNYLKSLNDPALQLLPARYDDGGYSGGSLNRPALQRLLADIQCGLVNRVIIYKIDRLTREIRDFFKLLDIFEKYNVEFVSVKENQYYNTTTAIGRLMVNMFLVFAQFERENAGDRIRDKIATSKAKGMWMGGCPPYGYDIGDRCLVINETEAQNVRFIYQTFCNTHSLADTTDALNSGGIRTKRYTTRQGRTFGGRKFSVKTVQRILQNPLYKGMVAHRGKQYPGQHAAIIDAAQFDMVQAVFAAHKEKRKTRRPKMPSSSGERETAALTGFIFCGCCGSAMTPSYCCKGDIRYHYYRCYRRASKLEDKCPINQIRTSEIDRVVMEQVLAILKSRDFFVQYISHHHEFDVSTAFALFNSLDDVWNSLFETEKRRILRELLAKVTIYKDKIVLDVKKAGLAGVFAELSQNNRLAEVEYKENETFQISVAYRATRLANGAKIIVPATAKEESRFNGSLRLARQIAKGFAWRKMMESGLSLQELTASAKTNERDIRFAMRLSMIDPAVVESVLSGKSPEFLTYAFMKKHPIPLLWSDQRKLYGFEERKQQ